MRTIAHNVGDAAKRARALVRAAEKESDDDEIVVEADAALAAHVDQGFIERFARRVTMFRRTEALRSIAQKHATTGQFESAVQLLERAHELAPDEVKAEVAKELSEALVGAGRGEDAVMRDLSRPDLEKATRAAKYEELARVRAERNDGAGAADALFSAATENPTRERWAAVEQAAERISRETLRVRAVEQVVRYSLGAEKIAALKRLARAAAARGKRGSGGHVRDPGATSASSSASTTTRGSARCRGPPQTRSRSTPGCAIPTAAVSRPSTRA
jgi:tetratricopeptide (TPR) repeat protein